MRWLLFLSRVAFICNLFSLLSILLLWRNFIEQQAIISIIAIIGYMMAIFFNPLANLVYGILLIAKRPIKNFVPSWLLITNFVFLLLQLQYIFFLNDTFHH
jgi:hypothetical protein